MTQVQQRQCVRVSSNAHQADYWIISKIWYKKLWEWDLANVSDYMSNVTDICELDSLV